MTKHLTRPEAILFDMGGVLLEAADRYDAENFPKSFPNGLPEPAPLDWFLAMSMDCIDRFVALPPPRPSLDCRPIIAEWLEKRDIQPSPGLVDQWHAIMEQWEARPIYPHVRPVLAELRAAGFRMGVVSNTLTAAESLRRHFDASGILQFFEHTVFSAGFGMSKPHPSIFRNALDAMRVDPARAWYVGDKPQRDVSGAHGVGMTAVLVDSAHVKHIHDGPDHVPDLRIRDISELPSVLAALE